MMRKVIAITNRHLVHRDYWDQLEQIVSSPVESLILREKDLTEGEYVNYARKALQLCNLRGKQCVLHNFGRVAVRLHIPHFQCSLDYLKTHTSISYYMATLGVSVHTPEEAHEAEKLGATYVIAGHVFPTPSKAAYEPIGVPTVKEICKAVSVPVYALGGVNPSTVEKLNNIPVKGVALMSGLMKSNDISSYVTSLQG
ncbi:thiamine phosphate synthase [Colibacter massiliensis]|uniref:thiamine phosphate synthase n=1 Tax=Colibacter massiliensis TaxID=1852379 RepID=UPI003F8E360F